MKKQKKKDEAKSKDKAAAFRGEDRERATEKTQEVLGAQTQMPTVTRKSPHTASRGPPLHGLSGFPLFMPVLRLSCCKNALLLFRPISISHTSFILITPAHVETGQKALRNTSVERIGQKSVGTRLLSSRKRV